MKIKGREFLQRLAQQELFISRDGQHLAVGLAKGTLVIALGLSQRFVDPYIKAGLPIKALTSLKEGTSGSNGFGTVAVMKNAPHPNAAKVYITWLLSKEGQELYGRALTQGTRRLDVDKIQYPRRERYHHPGGLREGAFLRRRYHHRVARTGGRICQTNSQMMSRTGTAYANSNSKRST